MKTYLFRSLFRLHRTEGFLDSRALADETGLYSLRPSLREIVICGLMQWILFPMAVHNR